MEDIVFEDVYDTLLRNGMYRNKDPIDLAKPISGSDGDFIYDQDEIEECGRMIGMKPLEVNMLTKPNA